MQIELSQFYSRLGTVAIILILGFILGKFKLISTKTNQELTNLLLTVFMPAALFMAFPSTYDEHSANIFFSGLIAGAIIMLVLIIISIIIFNPKWYKEKNLRYESQFAMIFNNATFLGYPIVVSTFGSTGVLAYCGFIVAFNIALFSYGIWLFERKITLHLIRSVIFNPNIIAVILGMIVFIFGFSMPEFVADSISFVGNATTPLSLICIGFMLSNSSFLIIFKKWRLILTAILQLTLCPLVTWGLLSLFNFPTEVIQVCTLIQTLPTATSLGLFAVKYGGDIEESSELVTVSTILSIFTMPLMVLLLLGSGLSVL